ncbi:MAG: two-component system response regulator [Ferrovum sp. 21-44-67]|nr:MAG: two-component system response regulator [Ferrovum sp. 21-44-67]HQU06939.1 response regulator [Ferrovaceae bacterium]
MPSNNKSQTLLIVDDTPDNITVLGALLCPFYHIKIANNGSKALKLAINPPVPDLILLDIMMPEMDGFEVIKRLKADVITKNIPVIFLTALTSADNESQGLRLGAVDYIYKPINPEITLTRIKNHLELKQAREILDDQNKWLTIEIAKAIEHNKIIKKTAIRALANVAESKDNETGNHILRTQNYINELARELAKTEKYKHQLTEEYIELITEAAPLHDIGKVGIPDEILHKPSKLNAEEWVTMKTHAEIGAKAIWNAIKDIEDKLAVKFFEIAIDIAGNHHEKWDGSGYPKQLKGEAIPLAARLMAVADVYDALINKRVYKPSFSDDETTKLIIDGSGTHFDPDIIESFKRIHPKFVEIKNLMHDEKTR